MTTQEKIAVMQAHVRGETIQVRRREKIANPVFNNDWKDLNVAPIWCWLTEEYRIKPKPREWCIEPESQWIMEVLQERMPMVYTWKNKPTIRVREVIE